MHGRTRVQQAARDAVGCADSFVRERPRCSVGTAAAVGIFIGALLSMQIVVQNDNKYASLTPKPGFGFLLVNHKIPYPRHARPGNPDHYLLYIVWLNLFSYI